MNINLKPTRFIIETGSPVVLTEFCPQFDSLVYEGLKQATLLEHDEILSKMKELILWNPFLGVFHASAMRFGITSERGLVAKQYIRVDSLRGKLSSKNFSPNGKGGRYVGVLTAGGAFKPRVTERLAYESPFVCFDAVCDAPKVEKLLTNMFIGVGYDAYKGQGEIMNISSIPLSEDVSITCNGEARRNIPLLGNEAIKGIKSFSPLVPPYYSDNKVNCISAQRVSVITHANVTRNV
ncbi:hypothetical protein [Vibrio parahaemolyticus]|nr:hypothetical protein [Vibrio parahaemolyticus]